MKDLDKFPTKEKRLRLRGRSLGDKDGIASYRLTVSDEGGGKPITRVESSCASFIEKPWCKSVGQGQTRVNPQNLVEAANGKGVSRKCENLHQALIVQKESCTCKYKEKGTMVDEAKTSCVKNSLQKLDQIHKPRNEVDKNMNEKKWLSKCGKQMEGKESGKQAEGKEVKGHFLSIGGREKRDRMKKDKEEIDRKNRSKQSKLRLCVTKETSPKELACDCYQGTSFENQMLEPKNAETERDRYTKEDENTVHRTKIDMLTAVKLVQQGSKGNQLCRQKSAEEHMGDLGNLVGSALSYPTVGDALYSPLLSLIIHPLSLRDLSSAPDKQDPGEETCHDNRKKLALKETDYEPTPQGEKTESKMKAEITVKHSTEDKAQDDCVKDSQESPVALIKWLSELQRDMENTQNKFQEIQKSFCTLKSVVSILEKQRFPNELVTAPLLSSLTKDEPKRKKARKNKNLSDMLNKERENFPVWMKRKRANFLDVLNRMREDLPDMPRWKSVRKRRHLPVKPSRKKLQKTENISKKKKTKKNLPTSENRKKPWKRGTFPDMPRKKRPWKRKRVLGMPSRRRKPKTIVNLPASSSRKRDDCIDFPQKKRPRRRASLPPLYTASTSQTSTPSIGKGDKSVQGDPVDSDGNRSQKKRKSSSDDLSEKENRNNDDEKDRDEKEDPPFNDRGPGKLLRGRSNELYTSDNMGDPNYKYRRKHGQLRNGQEQLADLLGLLSSLDQDIPPDLMAEIKAFIADINPCLVICLKKQSGEVVYAYRNVLLEVIQFWDELKLQYKQYGKLLNKSVKEEGVIYPDCKKLLQILGHRYQKDFQWVRLAHLGSGMFGHCHMAMDYSSEYHFCIKKIHISKYRADEIKIWSDLDHPNVVRFHGALRRKEKIYIIAEFIPGGNLTEVINSQKTLMRRLSQRKALQLFHQLLAVLVYLEKKSVIHEDIKSDNILLREDGREIVLADFGVARRQTTKVSNLVGTPTHFSPEKAESRGHDFKSDLWAACCVLLHVLSGDPPWVRRYPNATALHFLIATKPAPLDDVPKNIHKDVRSLIEKCLDKTPSERPAAKALLQHPAFQLIHESGDNMYSILSSGGLIQDDTRLPSTRQTGTTEDILREIQERMGQPEEDVFTGHVSVRDNITGILGKSEKMEDHPDVSRVGRSGDDHPVISSGVGGSSIDHLQRQISDGEVTNKHNSAVSFSGHLEQRTEEVKNREDSFHASIKKSILATQKDILEESSQDPVEFYGQFLSDDFPINNGFPFPDQSLYNPPLYHVYPVFYSTSRPSHEEEEQSADDLLNIPLFTDLIDEADQRENTDIERLHAQVFNEQLSKTSSSSDLLMPNYQGSQHSGSSGDFNQDIIIQTLMEEPENGSESSRGRLRSRSSTRSEETGRSSHSDIGESVVLDLLQKPEDGGSTSMASSNTIGGNLPHSILFDFDSKSKSSESFHTPAEEIIVVEEERKVDNEEKKIGEEGREPAALKKISTSQEGSRSNSEEAHRVDPGNSTQTLSKMIPWNPGFDSRRSPNSTMFDEVDQNITDDDLFADTGSYKSEEINKSKSAECSIKSAECSIKSSSSANLSSQEAPAMGPITPFTIEKDPQDPSKQIVVVDKDPTKTLPPPRHFRKPTQLNFRNPPKSRESSKRLSNPEVARPYTPLTPQKYFTPQINPSKPFTLTTPTSGYMTSTTRRSISPKERERDDEYEKLIRDLSHHSGDPISELDIEDQPAPIEDEPSLSEEEMFKYSLQLVRDKYITEPEDDKCVKVDVEKLDGEHFVTRLPFEYSNKPWKNFVEENFNMMKTHNIDMLTLHFLDNAPLDLQEKPIESHKNYRVALKVVEVTEHGRDDLPWYCQNGICRVGGGIPV
uniref:Uncharacterized protein LOC111111297 isoform X3 n=1 Tax=Crassostrea virginica TaxID=6565 RepID=A0A8B8BKN3_CRAVI|nr:uncharacterized protein LOC111111297 isoform X3 [Crassostrea virginica]